MWIDQSAEPLIGYEEAHGNTARPYNPPWIPWIRGCGSTLSSDLTKSKVWPWELISTMPFELAHEPLRQEELCPFSVIP